jgi:two-component sensor histidine kinase
MIVKSGRSTVNKESSTVHALFLTMMSFLLFAFPCHANRIPKDSTQVLWNEMLHQRTDSVRIRSIIHLSNYLINKPGAGIKQLDSANVLINGGIARSKKMRLFKLELKCCLALLTNSLIISKDTSGAAVGYSALISKFRQAQDLEGEAECWRDHGMMLSKFTNDFRLALKCHIREKQLFQKLGNNYAVAIAWNAMSIIYKNEGRFTEAAENLSMAYRYFRASGKGVEKVSCEIEMASLYWKIGNTQQALYFNSEAIKTAQMIKNEGWMAIATNSMGRIYFNMQMYAEALPYLERSMAAMIKTKSETDYAIALLSVIYDRVMLKRTDGLLKYLIQAERKMPAVEDSARVNIYCAYGLAHKAAGQIKEAERSFLEMLRTFNELKNDKAFEKNSPYFLQTYFKSIGEFYIDTNRPEKARPYFEKILALPKKYIAPASESEVQLSMYRIDSASGRYIPGLRHLQAHNRIHDSLYNASSANQVAGLKARYVDEQRSKDLAILKAEQRSQAVLMQTTKLQRNITLGGIAAVLVLACFAYWAYRKKQQVNKHLEDQKAKIDEQNVSLKSLLTEKDLLLADKELLLIEKDWLLTEVHHRVKNNLQVITSLLNFQSSATTKKDVLDAIKISRNRIQAISLIHLKLSNGNNLASLNMQDYVNELINHLRDVFDLPAEKIIFKKSIAPINIDLKQAVPVGLILNEAITNCIKYAFDSDVGEISVSLVLMEDQMIVLKIADNGKGFSSDIDPTRSKSLGFKIMRGLTTQLKGDFEVKCDAGTQINIQFPWRNERILKTLNRERVTAN